MGAAEIREFHRGTDANVVFQAARALAHADILGDDDADDEGYSGTIYEKHSFAFYRAEPVTGAEAKAIVDQLFEDDSDYSKPRVQCLDKYGPLQCLKIKNGAGEVYGFYFFGLAPE